MLSIIKIQSNRYKIIKTKIAKLEKEIRYQVEIQKHHSIPRKYKPNQALQIYESSRKLQLEFDTAFEQLFFTHLNKVIYANTVA